MNALNLAGHTPSILTPRNTEEKVCDKQSVPVRQILGGSTSRRLKYSTRQLITVKKLLARDVVRAYRKGVGGRVFLLPPVPLAALTPLEQAQVQQIVDGHLGAFFSASPIGGASPTPGNVVIGGVDMPLSQIDNMFVWGNGCVGIAGRSICESYARAMVDLMALPTGQALFRDIIAACRTNFVNNRGAGVTNATKRPERLIFVQNGDVSELIHDSSKPYQCELNLEWDATNRRIMEGHNVLIVNNTTTGALDFVGVAVSPALDLAHELGHFLYALNTPRGAGGLSVHNSVGARAQGDYGTIFNGVLLPRPPPPLRVSFKKFRRIWNHITYAEPVNILPSASMGAGGFTFTYSDGIMVGEALAAWGAGDPRRPQFFTLTNAAGMAAAVAPPGLNLTNAAGHLLPSSSFIRFSHRNSVGFFNVFSRGLNAVGRNNFRVLVGQLLNKITIPAVPGVAAHLCTIADLPQI
jgi:hypothetical protein